MCRFKLVVFVFFLFLPALSPAGEALTKIKICGSGDNQELLRRLARAYEGSQAGVLIEVPDSIGSSGGVKATATKQCDIGRLARPLRDKEMRYGLTYKLFARSPVVFVVSANLKGIANITAQQVVSIFSGQTRSWQELGGPSEKIFIAGREKGDSSRTVIEKHLIDFALIKNPVGKTIYSTPETVAIVASHDNIISYSALSSVISRPNIHVLSFEGVMPSVEAIATGQYPLYSEFGLVWRDDIEVEGLAFIAFLESESARKIIESYGAASVQPVKK